MLVLLMKTKYPLLNKSKHYSRLTRKVITDKNGHRRTVYVRLGLPVSKYGKDENVADKEPWDSSNEKAKLITPAMFGSPEEIKIMAEPIRTAKDRREATEILRSIVEKGIMTSKSGLPARLPGKSIGKIVSSEAAKASFDKDIHYLAAANLDKLYSNAIEPWQFDLNPGKNNDGLKNRRYLYAPLEVGDKVKLIKITVKEYLNEELTNKLYSIEAINVVLE